MAHSGKAPAGQHVPDAHARKSTGAAGRVSVPASLGRRDVASGQQGQVEERDLKTQVTLTKTKCKGKSLREHHKALQEHVAIPSVKTEDQKAQQDRQSCKRSGSCPQEEVGKGSKATEQPRVPAKGKRLERRQ